MTEHPADRFELVLKLEGWRPTSPGHLTKGDWQIMFDTGTVAAESIATVRSQLWAVTRDDVRQTLADRLDRAQTDLSGFPRRAADELLAFVHELQANPHGAIPEPAAEAMTRFASHASALLRAER